MAEKKNISVTKTTYNKYHTIEMLHKCDLSSHLTNCQILYNGKEKSYSASKLEVKNGRVDKRTMICIFFQ